MIRVNWITIANRAVNAACNLIGATIKAVVLTMAITAAIIITMSAVSHNLAGFKQHIGWMDLFK